MKTFKIILVAAIFCMTLTGLTVKKADTSSNNVEEVSQQDDFTYAFKVKRHVKKAKDVPEQG
ncbi:hypothetical protein ACFSQP_04965 [Bizionia sediminis]|uniref:Uncharacterized protein n=1 Tax=Bizionia sediminis TaxID=1737064 RepID=A0ABW5KS15_9FLAO